MASGPEDIVMIHVIEINRKSVILLYSIVENNRATAPHFRLFKWVKYHTYRKYLSMGWTGKYRKMIAMGESVINTIRGGGGVLLNKNIKTEIRIRPPPSQKKL